MSEKRFVLEISSFSDKHMKFLNILDNGKRLNSEDIVDLLNEQQATINELQSIIKHIKCEENCFDYDYCCETVCSLDKEIKHLKEENEQLKIANARWLDKSVQDKQTQYSNTNYQELTTKYLQLKEENEQLKEQVKRLQDIGTRTEEEKEHFADLYNECRRFKLSDEQIKQAYADLNRREREKHSQGNATYTSKINPNEVIY